MGTGAAVLTDVDGREFLVICDDAVFNVCSLTTLLSEYQMRENGLIVDSVSANHFKGKHQRGTQSIFCPEQNISIPLQLRGALMTCKHRLPTDDELNSLTKIHFTKSDIKNLTKKHNSCPINNITQQQ